MLPLGCLPCWGREGVALKTSSKCKKIWAVTGFLQSIFNQKISFLKIENKERFYTLSFTEYIMTEEQDSHRTNHPEISIGFFP
jgi:hypothetical protein